MRERGVDGRVGSGGPENAACSMTEDILLLVRLYIRLMYACSAPQQTAVEMDATDCVVFSQINACAIFF